MKICGNRSGLSMWIGLAAMESQKWFLYHKYSLLQILRASIRISKWKEDQLYYTGFTDTYYKS